MSALPAGFTEPTDTAHVGASAVRVQRRADRRAERSLERRSRQRWAVGSCTVLVGAFGVTVGILDVLH